MSTPRPEKLRPSSPARYEEISQHLLQQAEDELEKGDALQGSEKIWLSVAHELKAIAQQRGWNNRYHNHLRTIASCLSLEWDRPDWETTFGAIEGLHTNGYEHQRSVIQVQPYLALARTYCQDLAQTLLSNPPDVALSDFQRQSQTRLLNGLTRPLSEQAAFGEEFTAEELENLPPVKPPHV